MKSLFQFFREFLLSQLFERFIKQYYFAQTSKRTSTNNVKIVSQMHDRFEMREAPEWCCATVFTSWLDSMNNDCSIIQDDLQVFDTRAAEKNGIIDHKHIPKCVVFCVTIDNGSEMFKRASQGGHHKWNNSEIFHIFPDPTKKKPFNQTFLLQSFVNSQCVKMNGSWFNSTASGMFINFQLCDMT